MVIPIDRNSNLILTYFVWREVHLYVFSCGITNDSRYSIKKKGDLAVGAKCWNFVCKQWIRVPNREANNFGW